MSEEEIDDEIKRIEEEIKKIEGASTDYGSPETPKKESLFRFFRHILGMKDSTKVANLTASELGVVKLGVRHYKELALYADAEGLDKVSDYLSSKAEIISSTSMARKGFWAQLFVTNIKKELKPKEKEEQKKGWFAKKIKEEEKAGE